jgi:dihydrofolate reductase
MGRCTYDVFAPAWTSRSGDPYSDRINTMRKVVVSTTLTDPECRNTEVIADGVVDRVRDLTAQDGGHIVQYGFGGVSRLLLDHGLFDQLQLWIHPQLRPERRRRPDVPSRNRSDVRPGRLQSSGQRDPPRDLSTLIRRLRETRTAQRNGRKNVRNSDASNSGSSTPGKCPPDGISTQRVML